MTDLELNVTLRTDFYNSLFRSIQLDNQRNAVNVFDNLEEEYKTLHEGVALRDISHFGLIELQGKEILDFLNRISTNSLNELKPDFSEVTLFTNEKGRIIERSTVINFGEMVLLVNSDYFRHKLFSWINKYIIMEDIKIYDGTGKYAFYELLGPQADSFSTLIFDSDVDGLIQNQFKSYRVKDEDYFVVKKKEFDINKYWIIGKAAQGNELVKYMMEHKSVFDFRLVGENAYDKFRIETGIPAAPNELNDFYNPCEAGLINEVSFTKGCYIGQEVIARLDTYDKVQKNLCGIIFNSGENPEGNLTILENKREVGNVTSVTYSSLWKTNIGLAYIKKEFNEDGKILIAKSDNGIEYPVTITSLPFKR